MARKRRACRERISSRKIRYCFQGDFADAAFEFEKGKNGPVKVSEGHRENF